MSRKKTDIPEDPALRNEYFNKFAASVLFDADYILIYIDSQLSAETGMPSVASLLAHPECKRNNFTLENFTVVRAMQEEAIPPMAKLMANPKSNVLSVQPELYYGFWGTQFNAVLDIPPGSFYDPVLGWAETVFARPALPQAKESSKKPPPARLSIITTCTDGHCLRKIQDVDEKLTGKLLELDGCVTNWVCARPCCKTAWPMNPSFRFPVSGALQVAKQVTRMGTALDDPTPRLTDPLLALKSSALLSDPKRARAAIINPTSTHPTCPLCNSAARPQIKPVNPKGTQLPTPLKTWYTAVIKEIWPELEGEAMAQVLARHYNYIDRNKKPPKPKGGCRQRFVILELGTSAKSETIRKEHEKFLLAGRGTVSLIRVSKDESALVRDTSGDEKALEQMKADGVEVSLEALYYPILAKSISDAIFTLNEFVETRYDWISEWDDLKARQLRYGKKK